MNDFLYINVYVCLYVRCVKVKGTVTFYSG